MNTYIAIALTLFLAMIFSVAQGVTWLSIITPPWSLLMLAFWCIFGRHSLGVLSAAFLGLLQDSIMSTTLGLHMFSYAVVMAFIMSQKKRLKIYSFWQQSGVIFFALLFVQFIQYVFLSLHTEIVSGLLVFMLPAVIGALLWPMLVSITLGLFRHFHVFDASF